MKVSLASLRAWARKYALVLLTSPLLVGDSRAEDPASPGPAEVALNQPAPPALSPDPPRVTLPEVEVVAEPPQATQTPVVAPQGSIFGGSLYDSPFYSRPVVGYGATTANAGMLADTPLLSIPQSIGIVTADAMRDQEIFSVTEAFRNVSGFNADNTTGSLAASSVEFNYLARGLPSTYRRWNGYRSDLIQPSIDAANIERIEFLKGPSSVLYGASEAGGFLNVITKKPLDDNFTRSSISSGSWGLARTTVDANRKLNDFTLFRLNMGFQSADSFRDYVNDDRIQITPAATIELTDRMTLTFEGEYYLANTKYDLGYPFLNGNYRSLPRSRFLMDPTDRADGDYYKSLVQLNHQLTDTWATQLGFHYATANQRASAWSPFGEIGGFTPQYPVVQNQQGNLASLNGYVVGEVQTGRLTHHLSAGFEFNWIDTAAQTGIDFFGDYGAGPGAGYPLNASNPFYASQAGVPFPAVVPEPYSLKINADVGSFQDRIVVNEYWELVGGVSYQNFDRSQRSPSFLDFDDNVNGWTPKGAVIYHPVPDLLSTWYSYTESLNSQLFPLANPGPGGAVPLAPSQGQQHEIGVRLAANDDLVLSASIFSLDKQGVPIFRPLFAGGSVAVDARSQGFEFDMYGRVTDRLSMIANYAYTDSSVTNDNGFNLGLTGSQFPLVPRNRANVWSRYNLIDVADLNRYGRRDRRVLGVGLGTRWQDSMQTPSISGFLGPAVTLPSAVTVDAGLFLERNRLLCNIYFENLGDVTYFSSGMGSFANPANPFNVRFTAGWTF